MGQYRFKYRPVRDSQDAVEVASRNVVLYPPTEILSASSSMYDFQPMAILEFFEYFRLDNMRLVVFHKGATGSSELAVHTEPFYGTTYTKSTKLREHRKEMWEAWAAIDRFNDATKLEKWNELAGLKTDASIPEDFALKLKNEFIPTNFSLKVLDFCEDRLHAQCGLESPHNDGSHEKGPGPLEEKLFQCKATLELTPG